MPAEEVMWRLAGQSSSGTRVSKVHLIDPEHTWKARCGRRLPRKSQRTYITEGDERCRQCAAVGTTEAARK